MTPVFDSANSEVQVCICIKNEKPASIMRFLEFQLFHST